MNEVPPTPRYIDVSRALRFPPLVRRLAGLFDGKDNGTYLFGGAVRDSLLGRDVEDIDIVVDAGAEAVGRQIAESLDGRCVPLHGRWQVARVLVGDQGESGRIDISTFEGGIERHLLMRDYTINAMAMPIDRGLNGDGCARLLDPCGGLKDLDERVLRMVSSEALEEDAVRLMRGARLASQLQMSVEPQTADAIRERSSLIGGAPPERVRDELMRILQTSDARDGVRLLDELGLLCGVFPELAEAKGVTQPKEHYWDVFNHLVEAVGWVESLFDDVDWNRYPVDSVPRFGGMDDYFAESVSDGFDRVTLLKLAALLHDVAKPATRTIEDSGRIRFIGHHVEGSEMVHDILTRLRFGNRGVKHVAAMVRHHLRPRMMSQRGKMPTGRALYRYYRDVGDVALDTLYLNTADYLAARGPMLEREDWASHCRLISHILEKGRHTGRELGDSSVKSLPKLVDGYDIMDRFALAPGPRVGRLLEAVRDAQAGGEIDSREQAIELVRTRLEPGGDGA